MNHIFNSNGPEQPFFSTLTCTTSTVTNKLQPIFSLFLPLFDALFCPFSPINLSTPQPLLHSAMHFKVLARASLAHIPYKRSNLDASQRLLLPQSNGFLARTTLRVGCCGLVLKRGLLVTTSCVSPGSEIVEVAEDDMVTVLKVEEEDVGGVERDATGLVDGEAEVKEAEMGSQSILSDIKEIVMFTGPATGLWLCGPLMSLIDTAVIGQGSSIELAALGPGTVLCDYMSYVFMFLSIATSNMVATSLAKKDKGEVQHQISVLLFVGLVCGVFMLIFTKFYGALALTAFVGSKNAHIVSAADTYVQIRGLAWPAVLIGWVAQSASLGMKDSWGPLKALAVASVVNGIGDIVLCSYLGYGIAGAAWATMVSQVIAGYMMIQALNDKGYNAFAFTVPSSEELLQMVALSAPVFVTMMAKVAFYSLIIYFATSMGTHTVAAHQVMIQTYSMCTVCGEPLSQTAQSFMPELLYGAKRSLLKARNLLKSLLIIGATVGIVLGSVGTFVPWLFPNIFTSDPAVRTQMHQVLIPYFLSLSITPCTHSLEGSLLAGRELKFLSLSMSGCFTLGALMLVVVSSKGYGLPGCWYGLVGFQWARFFLAIQRLFSPKGVLLSDNHQDHHGLEKLKAA